MNAVAEKVVEGSNEANAFNKAIEKPTTLPKGFYLLDSGVHYDNPDDDKDMIWICARLEVVSHQRDIDSKNWGSLLEFKDADDVVHQWAMPRSMLKDSGAEYRGVLLDMGLSISHGRRASDLLSQYINGCIPHRKATSVDKIGWYKSVYVLPNKTIGNLPADEAVIYQSTSTSLLGFAKHGNLTSWNTHIGHYTNGNSRLIFAVSLALSGTLLKDLNVNGGGFHMLGGSSIGKSTINHLACSVWGDVSRFKTWRATGNALEQIALMHNDNCLLLDEIGEVKKTEIENISYMLANGSGKERSNKGFENRETKTWRLLYLSNGEVDVATIMQSVGQNPKDGQLLRLANINADTGVFGVFEELHGFSHGGQLADHLKSKSECYHGALGVAFIEEYVGNRVTNIEFAKEVSAIFMQQHKKDDFDGQISRVMSRFALVASAGELAIKFGLTTWEEGDAVNAVSKCFETWLEDRATGNSEAIDAINQIRSFIERHEDSRFEALQTKSMNSSNGYSHQIIRDKAGYKHRENGEDIYYIFPDTFKSEVCKGINYKTAVSELRARSFLKYEAGRDMQKVPQNQTGKRPRMYAIKGELLNDE